MHEVYTIINPTESQSLVVKKHENVGFIIELYELKGRNTSTILRNEVNSINEGVNVLSGYNWAIDAWKKLYNKVS